jgi:hypothetical protein
LNDDLQPRIHASHALLRGLRRPGGEAQLTKVLAAVCCEDAGFARALLGLVLHRLRGPSLPATASLEVIAEESVRGSRFDLRFRGAGWDVIVELKIHADYGREQLDRYRGSLTYVEHAYVAAITRDVPWGEPPPDSANGWLGASRWRDLLPGLRALPVADPELRMQWQLFLDILEEEGSMGFTRPDPDLFNDFARARLANRHMEELLLVLERPLLDALRDAVGGEAESARLHWSKGGRFSHSRWGRLDIPFRVPSSSGDWRVRAGLIGWEPPAAFCVQPAPDQRWDTRVFTPGAQAAVDSLVGAGFDRKHMRKYLGLEPSLIASPDFERQLVEWARKRFAEIEAAGVFRLPVEAFGPAAPPESNVDQVE